MKINLPDDVKFIIKTLTENGYEAYAVGGCVRDSIIRRVPEDWDITTSAGPAQVKKLFANCVSILIIDIVYCTDNLLFPFSSGLLVKN